MRTLVPSPVRVIGTGLIGGSLGMALRRAGVDVQVEDVSPGTAALAVELGAGSLPSAGDRHPELVLVAGHGEERGEAQPWGLARRGDDEEGHEALRLGGLGGLVHQQGVPVQGRLWRGWAGGVDTAAQAVLDSVEIGISHSCMHEHGRVAAARHYDLVLHELCEGRERKGVSRYAAIG